MVAKREETAEVWRLAQSSFRSRSVGEVPGYGRRSCVEHEFSVGPRAIRAYVPSDDPSAALMISPEPDSAEERAAVASVLNARLAGRMPLEDQDRPAIEYLLNRYATLPRVFVETSALNWLADHGADANAFFDLRVAGRFAAFVTVEVAIEIRNTKQKARLQQLEEMLARFFPIWATRIPRLGYSAILGLMILATDEAIDKEKALSFLKDHPDRTHLVNAALWRASVFLTRDAELWRDRADDIREVLGPMTIRTPAAFLHESTTSGHGR